MGIFGGEVTESINSTLTAGSSALSGFNGKLTGLFDGNFAGISEEGIETLTNSIKVYCGQLETKINEFNSDADMSQVFAGTPMQDAVREFVTAVKSLLQAYVSSLRYEIDHVNKAYQEWQSGTSTVAGNTTSSADAIRSAANANIKLD